MKLSTLKKQAQSSTSFRGHRMKWGATSAGSKVQFGQCRMCGKEVMLNTSPAPNEINIGGEALALSCDD